MKDETRKLIEAHEEAADVFLARVERAAEVFGDIDAYIAAGYAESLDWAGLWECDYCGEPVEDMAHPHADVGCVLLDDGTGCGTVVLCHDCHGEAIAARKKIVVDKDDEYGLIEDDSALTADERELADYLEHNSAGVARQARDTISIYPRDERRGLHHYQDKIDADRRMAGKTRKGGAQ